jgi:hypothetical protein
LKAATAAVVGEILKIKFKQNKKEKRIWVRQ